MRSFTNYHSNSHDPNIFLWMMGGCDLGIIDMNSRQYDVVPGLGGASVQDSLAHAAVSADNGRRVITLTSKSETPIIFINYWRKGAHSVVHKPVNLIDNSGKQYFLYKFFLIIFSPIVDWSGDKQRWHNPLRRWSNER
jgi:hypothetical protein